jgi:protocatechuate 3,4-dioxygenase beta subunit
MSIYPGWYSGRAVHIHFRIRNSTSGGTYDFISQLFFNDSLTDTVYTQSPYSRGARSTSNAADGIYNQGGSQLLLAPTQSGGVYSATMPLALSF